MMLLGATNWCVPPAVRAWAEEGVCAAANGHCTLRPGGCIVFGKQALPVANHVLHVCVFPFLCKPGGGEGHTWSAWLVPALGCLCRC